jgi:hypothetical protein
MKAKNKPVNVSNDTPKVAVARRYSSLTDKIHGVIIINIKSTVDIGF